MRDDCSLFFKEYTIVRVQEFRGENYYLSFNQECEIRNVQGTGNIYKVESQCLHLKLGSYALVRQTFTLSP